MNAVGSLGTRCQLAAIAVAAALALSVTSAVLPVGLMREVAAADVATTVIERYRERIPQLMAEQEIPGLAVALVDADEVLWVEGFGQLDGPDSAPVTPDTMFSVQSTSKLFTATAVMQAAAAGRVDLDEPITTYLPEFTVHSAFEEHPERKITLRMLLSHTAGLTFDAPVGNNNDVEQVDFDTHVRSISDTWLRFPVGSGYAYSNQGIDLAAYILERVEGKPFPDVADDTLFRPLGMVHSTFDGTVIRSTDDRALGHAWPFPEPPLNVPMTAAGGLYTSAADLARFLRFQLNDGSLDGRTVLNPRWMDEMRTVPAPWAGAQAGYALGVTRRVWNRWSQRPDLFDHGGGGFGFGAALWWAPQLEIGIAILTNTQDNELAIELPLSILGDLVAGPPYRDRLLALPARPPVDDPNLSFRPPTDMTALVASAAMPPTGDEATRWAAHAGSFGAPKWGAIDPTKPAGRFFVDHGIAYWEAIEDDSVMTFRLVEVEPDIFLADNGETLDLAGPIPRWRSMQIVRLTGGPAPWQWAILVAAAIAAATWLLAALARTIRRLRSRSRPSQQPAAAGHWHGMPSGVEALAALLVLGSVALVAAMPGLVDSGFMGWVDFPIAMRLAFHLPLALAVLGAGTVWVTAAGWVGHWWSGAVRLQYAALALAALALAAQLGAWHLIGWGFG